MLVALGCLVASAAVAGSLDVARSGASSASPESSVEPCLEAESATVGGQTLCFVEMDSSMRDMLTGTAVHDHATMETTNSSGSTSAESAAAATSTGPKCLGDGVSGRRVQILYMATDASTSFTPTVRTQLESMINGADDIFNMSAAQTGGARFVRWQTEPWGGAAVPRSHR